MIDRDFFHVSLLLLSERRADNWVLNDQKFYFLLPQTPWILRLFCRKVTGAGIAGQQLLPFTCGSSKARVVVFFPFCPSQSFLFSRSSPETTTIPISKWVCWVVPWRNGISCIAYCIVADFPEMVLLYCYHLMYCVHICNAYWSI